jgi:predicted ester cyclase
MTTRADGPTPAVVALVARFFRDVLNRENPAAAAELLAADFAVHHPAFDEGTPGEEIVRQFLTGFPDLHYTVAEIIADGDRAVVRWSATGTHRGEFLRIAPTERQVTVVGADVFHSASGRLAATWVNSDLFGLFKQLGVFPSV